jgi:hypothetical protein
MRIRMLVAMPDGATRNGQPWPAKGEITELPTAEAAHLVASEVAEEVTDTDNGAQAAEPEPRRGRRKSAPVEEG